MSGRHKMQTTSAESLQIERMCPIHRTEARELSRRNHFLHIRVAYHDDGCFKMAPTLGFWNKNGRTVGYYKYMIEQ